MEPAIRVENLGKLYRVTGRGERANYATLRETVMHAAGAPLRWARKGFAKPDPAEDFWALNDVNFEVMPGEVVGIIGRNGAGKSTLLKILSRITKPTTGRVTLNGRVGSLLEVGTGFHPELTGRENVYLNGSILGMTRREIAKKFDEIVAFAEVERFLDTPVKRYSSGMYVRLAFAVAAHLEPEILIVDEVLAVGDAAFQQKCIGKMQEVGRQGRTVVFVSHDIKVITRMCERTVLLDAGGVKMVSDSLKVAALYTQMSHSLTTIKTWSPVSDKSENKVVSLFRVRFCNSLGDTVVIADTESLLGVEMTFDVHTEGYQLAPNVHFYSGGTCIFISIDSDRIWLNKARQVGRYSSTVWVPPNLLNAGELQISVAITRLETQTIYIHEREVISIFVSDVIDSPVRACYKGSMPGLVRPALNWDTTYTGSFDGADLGGIKQ